MSESCLLQRLMLTLTQLKLKDDIRVIFLLVLKGHPADFTSVFVMKQLFYAN